MFPLKNSSVQDNENVFYCGLGVSGGKVCKFSQKKLLSMKYSSNTASLHFFWYNYILFIRSLKPATYIIQIPGYYFPNNRKMF